MRVINRFLLALLGVLTLSLRATADEAPPFTFRLVPIVQGNRESSFGDDEARWQTTPVAKAAAVCGVDAKTPSHPLVVHSYKNQRLFYLFYNTIDNAFDEKAYVIQRIKRTIKDYASPDDREPRTTVTHLVEVMKIKNFTFRPDQHFGNFGLGTSHRREIIKECEVGFGEIPGKAEGNAWPFDPKRLFEVVQEQTAEPGLYDKVQFVRSRTWKISAWFDRNGNYGLQSPEMGIDAPKQVPDLADARPPVNEESAKLVLLEGQGLLDLVIGQSKAEDIEKVLGRPLKVERPSATAQNYHHKQGLTFNVLDGGGLNTVITRADFAGKTAKGIGLGATRDQVLEKYGVGNERGKVLTYPGVLFYLDAENRVERMVLFSRDRKVPGNG